MAESSPVSKLREVLRLPDADRRVLETLLDHCAPRGDINAAAEYYFACGGPAFWLEGNEGADGAGPSNANDEDTEMEDADDAPQPARAGGLSPAGGPSRRRHNPHAHGGTASDNEADDENDAGAKPARSGALDARQRTPPRHNGATGADNAAPWLLGRQSQAQIAAQGQVGGNFEFTDDEEDPVSPPDAPHAAANPQPQANPQPIAAGAPLLSGWSWGGWNNDVLVMGTPTHPHPMWKDTGSVYSRYTWDEMVYRGQEMTLTPPDLTNAKLRQSPTYPENMKLPYLHLRDASGRLHCTDPNEVPNDPPSPKKSELYDSSGADFEPTDEDTFELGLFNVSIMPPGTKSMRPGEARRIKAMENWHDTDTARNQRKINKIVHPLLESGVLPLSSLRLVGGNCLGKVCRARSDGAWWSNVERVAVAVLQGSLGYEELHEAWVAAGLTVHTCQKPDNWLMTFELPLDKQPRTSCLVLGYVAPEYIRALRALAVLSPMPQNLAKSLDASQYSTSATSETTQERFAKVRVTSYLGVRMDTQKKIYEAAENSTSEEEDESDSQGEQQTKKKRRNAPKKKQKTTVYVRLVVSKEAIAKRLAAHASGSAAAIQSQAGASGLAAAATAAAGISGGASAAAAAANSEAAGAAAGPSGARASGASSVSVQSASQRKRKRSDAAASSDAVTSAKSKAGATRDSGASSAGQQPPGDPAPARKVQMSGILPLELKVTFKMGHFIRAQRISKGCFPADYRQELPSYGVYVHGQQRGRIISGAFGELIHTMLTYGSGLHIGPDCDGQLNLCDDTLHTPPPNSGPSASQAQGSLGDRFCGLTIKEWASMAKSQYEHLAHVWKTEWEGKVQKLRVQEVSFKKNITDLSPYAWDHYNAADSEVEHVLHSVPGRDSDLVKRLLHADAIISWNQGKEREAEISLELAHRVMEAFHSVGLCEKPPPPSREVSRQDGAAAGPSNAGAGASNARAASRRKPLHEQHVLPLTSGIHVGLILAAERISGKAILRRDPQGWIARVRCEDSTGGVLGYEALASMRAPAQGELPPLEFNITKLLDSMALSDDYPTAPVPTQLKTKPKKFQLQGLAFMLAREQKREALDRGLLQLDPFWVQLVTKSGYIFYINRIKSNTVSKRFVPAPIALETRQDNAAEEEVTMEPDPRAPWKMRPKKEVKKNEIASTCGGFLCDEMGLGKTLESLMLILSNPPPPGWAVGGADYEVPKDGDPVPIKTTLVIVPKTLLDQWQEEVHKHVKKFGVRWGVCALGFEGRELHRSEAIEQTEVSAGARVTRARSGRAATPKGVAPKREKFMLVEEWDNRVREVPISEVDIVFVTYEQLNNKELIRKLKDPLSKYGFWRIMLDEAQLMGQSSSVVAAEVAASLTRRQAWVITGTPINSKLSEISGLLSFLNYQPYSEPLFWKSNLYKPYQNNTAAGLWAMRGLLRGLMLRRTKAQVEDQLRLPPCTREDKLVAMNGLQRSIYDQLAAEYRRALGDIESKRSDPYYRDMVASNRYYTGGATSLLTALRQACCHHDIVIHKGLDKILAKAKASLREMLGSQVMEANVVLDKAAVENYRRRSVAVAAELSSVPVPNIYKILTVLVEVQAGLQLARMYDVRQAALHRKTDGSPHISDDTINEAIAGMQQRARQLQDALTAGQAHMAPPANYTVFSIPDKDLVVPFVPGPNIARVPDGHAAMAAAEAYVAAGGNGAFNMPFFDIHEKRPFGVLPECALTGNPVVAVLSGLPENSELAQALQVAAQEEVDSEITQTTEEREQRLDRWHKLEHDVLVLSAYVLRKRFSTCVELARLIDDPLALHEGEQGEPAWGTGVEDGVRKHAVFLWGLQQRINAVRVQLGLQALVYPPRDRRSVRKGTWDHLFQHGPTVEKLASFMQECRKDPSHANRCLKITEKEMGGAMGNLRYKMNQEKDRLHGPANDAPAAEPANGGVPAEGGAGAAAVDAPAAPTAGEAGDAGAGAAGPSNPAAAQASAVQPASPAPPAAAQPALPPLKNQLTAAGQAMIAAALAEYKEVSEEKECIICWCEMQHPAVTTCGHSFCMECIKEHLAKGYGSCPTCRNPLAQKDISEVLSESEREKQAMELLKEKLARDGYGAKIELMLAELQALYARDPEDKALVVSSWPPLIKLVRAALETKEIDYADMLDPDKRASQLDRFRNNPQCRVLILLLSHSSGAAGLTLTEASTIFILDPPMEPGLEAQVAARVHRLGQTRETRVIRIITEDSVEQSVIAYQQSQLALMARRQQRQDAAAAANGAAAAAAPGEGAAANGAAVVAAPAQGAAANPDGAAAAAAGGNVAHNEQELARQLDNDFLRPNTLLQFFAKV